MIGQRKTFGSVYAAWQPNSVTVSYSENDHASLDVQQGTSRDPIIGALVRRSILVFLLLSGFTTLLTGSFVLVLPVAAVCAAMCGAFVLQAFFAQPDRS